MTNNTTTATTAVKEEAEEQLKMGGDRAQNPNPQPNIIQANVSFFAELAHEINEYQGRTPNNHVSVDQLKDVWAFYAKLSNDHDSLKQRMKALYKADKFKVGDGSLTGIENGNSIAFGQGNVIFKGKKADFNQWFGPQQAKMAVEHLLLQGYDIIIINKSKSPEFVKEIAKAVADKNFKLATNPDYKEALGINSVEIDFEKSFFGQDLTALAQKTMQDHYDLLMDQYNTEQLDMSGQNKEYALPEMINDRLVRFEDAVKNQSRLFTKDEDQLRQRLSELQDKAQEVHEKFKNKDNLSPEDQAKLNGEALIAVEHALQKLSYDPLKFDDYVNQGNDALGSAIKHDMMVLDNVEESLYASIGETTTKSDLNIESEEHLMKANAAQFDLKGLDPKNMTMN